MYKIISVFVIFIIPSITLAETCKGTVLPKLNPEISNAEIVNYLKNLSGTVLFADKEVKGSYCYLINWYEEGMSSRRVSSRLLAMLIIVLGASLPLIGILENIFTYQKFWVAFIGAVIVVGQGFSQTFQYEDSWRNNTIAKLELEAAHRSWQKDIIDALYDDNGLESAKKATNHFASAVTKIVVTETNGFFDSLSEQVNNLTNKSNESQ